MTSHRTHTVQLRTADGTARTRELCTHLRPSGALCTKLPPEGKTLCRDHDPDEANSWLRGAQRDAKSAASARRCAHHLPKRSHGGPPGQCRHRATGTSAYCVIHGPEHRGEPANLD